jgi:hypothetical protein
MHERTVNHHHVSISVKPVEEAIVSRALLELNRHVAKKKMIKNKIVYCYFFCYYSK